ncbi:hypothetical protein [Paenibacillus sp. ACRRY]|uniref:hypothetical protein n=1 Tax=Paenibacillus sp. ACRRY TaxID=2918208 RepID=UPI001EF6F9FD|nr:hypothetical protein [Paenibacillus sp. ACRRY]MCG7381719.1 hypothetical protein [Paenibacillus sp. ACRRY]
MDIIMDEARKRGMKVWLLDDDHFPTGHAAGKIQEAPEELHRLFLGERYIDNSCSDMSGDKNIFPLKVAI